MPSAGMRASRRAVLGALLGFLAAAPAASDVSLDSAVARAAGEPGLDAERHFGLGDLGFDPGKLDYKTILRRMSAIRMGLGDPLKCDKGNLDLRVTVSVFGDLGRHSDEQRGALRQQASRWIFTTLLRSMFHSRPPLDSKVEQCALVVAPVANIRVVKAFEVDPEARGGWQTGARSPLDRTFFEYFFRDVSGCCADQMAGAVCQDYQKDSQELLNGLLRALDMCDLYPRHALDVAAKLGQGLRTIMQVNSWVNDTLGGGGEVKGMGCKELPSRGGPQSVLFLPPCPANSVRCEERQGLCSDMSKPYLCKCVAGYKGDLRLLGVDNLNQTFQYTGTCSEILSYCNAGAQEMVLAENTSVSAKGTLGEKAQPKCKPGYVPLGVSTCSESGPEQGIWSPQVECWYVPPNKPPVPFCNAPENQSGALLTQSCGRCQAVLPNKTGPACSCEMQCNRAAGFKAIRNPEGRKACLDSDFPCRDASELEWDGMHCFIKGTKNVTEAFCCDQAWGRTKPGKLQPKQCRDVIKRDECLQSMQQGGREDGAPCCWRDAGFPTALGTVRCLPHGDTSIATDAADVSCAVPDRVPYAVWDRIPTCSKMCTNKFDPTFTAFSGCDDCVPELPCPCTVTCRDGLDYAGGGSRGRRSCSLVPSPAGPVPKLGTTPLCEARAPPPACNPPLGPEGGKLDASPDCAACRANATCNCDVACPTGHVVVGSVAPGRKRCLARAVQLPRRDCTQIRDAGSCLGSHNASDGNPCCWRSTGFMDGVQCVARGSPLINASFLPLNCSATVQAEWEPLPKCAPLCTNIPRASAEVEVEGCHCHAGQADCVCRATCAAGYVWYGGGPEGARSCSATDLAFTAAPVCGKPLAGANLPCGTPTTGPGVALRGCGSCAAGQPCQCNARCSAGYVRVGGGEEGARQCTKAPVALRSASCASILDEAGCLGSQDSVTGSPCSFHPQGLQLNCTDVGCQHTGPVCLPLGSSLMQALPLAVAPTSMATWDSMPDCQPLCRNTLLGASGVVLEGDCDRCVAGRVCNCSVKCASGYERYGGGGEGGRSCTAERLDFEAAPFCAPQETATCPVPTSADGSVQFLGCQQCEPGKECVCTAQCADTYGRVGGGQPGTLACRSVPNALAAATCSSLTASADCLGSMDVGRGAPCCWRDGGFLDGSTKCAAKGDGTLIDASTPVSPKSCAPTATAVLDPAPVCKAMCINSFKTSLTLKAVNCDGCFVNEPCGCSLQCASGTKCLGAICAALPESIGCGHIAGAPQSYDAPPTCVFPTPPAARQCPVLGTASGSLEVTGCAGCLGGSTDCACSVRCAASYRRVGGGAEGAKACLAGIYACPRVPVWNDVEAKCRDGETQREVDTLCCPEATYDTPPELPANECIALTSKESCLAHRDTATNRACCWRSDGFGGTSVTCVPSEDARISSSTPAEACADRPAVPTAFWQEPPRCAPVVPDPYAQDPTVVATGCANCAAGDTADACPCRVDCKPGTERIGGGPAGPRQPDASGAFPPAPVCQAPLAAAACEVPRDNSLNATGCAGCLPGAPGCSCEVRCASGYALVAGAEGKAACELTALDLPEQRCDQATSSAGCTAGKQAGSGAPCCFHPDGFTARYLGTSYWGPPRCLPLGDAGMMRPPTSCAQLQRSQWRSLPKCLPKCVNPFRLVSGIVQEGCDNCIAGQACPCRVSCAEGFERVGGGLSGSRQCTMDKLTFDAAPVCVRRTNLTCPPVDLAGGALRVEGCTGCVAGQECPSCSMTCVASHIPSSSSTEPGARRCVLVPAQNVAGTCSSITDSVTCRRAVEDGEPCCWQQSLVAGGSFCARRGSSNITEPPVCAPMSVAQWAPAPPTCLPRCVNSFREQPGVVFRECDRCNTLEPCNCRVECAAGFEHYGGGPPGPRSCSPQSPAFAEPPLCLPPEQLKPCTNPASSNRTALGCEGCVVGKSCSCSVSCAAGHMSVSGTEGPKTCEAADSGLRLGTCSLQTSPKDCLGVRQTVGGAPQPCCWSLADARCSAKTTRDIPLSTLSGSLACAPMWQTSFPALPDCRPKCDASPLTSASAVVVTGCGSCYGGVDCSCSAVCAPGAVELPRSPGQGKKACLPSGVFEGAPLCAFPCRPPVLQNGRLDVFKCASQCVPGQPCQCSVSCAAGNVRVAGGLQGVKSCVTTSGGAAFADLPVCIPQCAPPDNQFNTLDTSGCSLWCNAGNTSCPCNVRCLGKRQGGGQEGDKTCRFRAGDQTTPARGIWVDATSSADTALDQMPTCLVPVWVKAVDAQSQVPLKNVLVTLFEDETRTRIVDQQLTGDSGMAQFFTSMIVLPLSTYRKGYINVTDRTVDRIRNCEDPKNCGTQISLSADLGGRAVLFTNCSLMVTPGSEEWRMRAVLEWDASPSDLDIWARNFDCANDTAARYGCIPGSGQTCRQAAFSDPAVKTSEMRSCGVRKCWTTDMGQTEIKASTAEPDCEEKDAFENQYPKWVFFDGRFAGNLSTLVTNAGNTISRPRLDNWNRRHWMVLDIDQRNGYGPETVTFENVPPGRYQVVVNKFSDEFPNGDLTVGNPRVRIYVGENNIAFECKISPTCNVASRLWNVVNIQIDSAQNGRELRLRVVDREDKMVQLNAADLPSSETRTDPSAAPGKTYFNVGWATGASYTDTQTKTVCYGTCRAVDERYKECVESQRTAAFT